jgi:transcriptional regulator with XRE-family HTH domain
MGQPAERSEIRDEMTEPHDPNAEWKKWMRAFGRQERRIREFLGLSQEQIARLAGVSQGAVSRLEAGRGLATPLLVVLKINLAVNKALQSLDPALLTEEMRRSLEFQRSISPKFGDVGFDMGRVTADPNIETLIRTYRSLPEKQRQTFVTVIQATATALAAGAAPAGGRQKA